MTTTILGLPELDAAQAQKYLTVNQALERIDALVNLTVFNRTVTAPPGSPSAGDRYIVAATATGAFAGQENKIAVYIGSSWIFFAPSEGWRAYDQGADQHIYYNGTSWLAITASVVSGGAHGSAHTFYTVEEELTGLSGATVSSSFAFPNQSLIYGVSMRVTTAITGATSFDVGDGSSASRFGGTLGISLGSTNQGTISPAGNYASTNVVLTANGGSFTGGAVRIAAHYSVLGSPTT